MARRPVDLYLHAGWWLSIGLIVLFIPYFPYTKHIHLIMGPFNFMTRPNRTYLGQMYTLDFEDESIEQFGAATLFDLDKTRYSTPLPVSCVIAARKYARPTTPAKNFHPRPWKSTNDITPKQICLAWPMAEANGSKLIDFAISESAVWACTACGHCIEVCPVGNTPMLDIMDIRRDQVLMESNFPEELKGAFVGMERAGNPWQSTESRMEWAKPLAFSVPTVEENPITSLAVGWLRWRLQPGFAKHSPCPGNHHARSGCQLCRLG